MACGREGYDLVSKGAGRIVCDAEQMSLAAGGEKAPKLVIRLLNRACDTELFNAISKSARVDSENLGSPAGSRDEPVGLL
jgi:hypothetical protein